MTKRSSPAGQVRSGEEGASERRVQSRSTPSEPKPGSLWSRVLLPHPGSTTGHLIAPGDHYTLQDIQVHLDVDFQADFEDVRWHDVALTWNHTKDHSRSRKFCFHHPGHVEPSGFVFWGCWQWSCCHNLESMSCTAAHLQSGLLNIVSLSDMVEGSYRSWDLYTTGKLLDGLQQKKKTSFH